MKYVTSLITKTPLTKGGIKSLASKGLAMVEEGKLNAADLFVFGKFLEKLAEELKAALKDQANSEILKGTQELEGVKLTSVTRADIDYAATSPRYAELKAALKEKEAAFKRENEELTGELTQIEAGIKAAQKAGAYYQEAGESYEPVAKINTSIRVGFPED